MDPLAPIVRIARIARAALAPLAACAALAACGGGGGPGTGDGGAGPAPDAPADLQEKLVRADAQALLAHFRERLRASAAGAWDGDAALPAIGAPRAPVPTTAGASLDAASSPISSTPLQEPGVDEHDVLRVDGDVAWALSPPAAGRAQRLGAWRIAGGGATLAPLGGLELDATVHFEGLYVDAPRRRVVAVGRRAGGVSVDVLPAPLPGGGTALGPPVAPAVEPAAVLAWIDVADPAQPRLERTVSMSGRLQASRIAGGRLWLVLGGQPRLDGFDGSWRDTAANDRWLAALTVDRLLPTWRVDDGPQAPLLDGDACWLQPAAAGGLVATTSVVSVELAAPAARPVGRCLVAPVDTVYMTADALYLTTQRYTASMPVPMPATDGRVATTIAPGPVTDVHRLALAGAAVVYRGSGSVPGRLGQGNDTSRFMLSADGPRLRVVSQRDGAGAAGPAVLSVLEDTGDGALRTVATLPNARRPEPIGKPGEQVHAVRFVGARAYLVTFRRVDPVYVIDLADPADPRLLGALEVPGFSDRLVPLTGTLLLGVGHDSVPWQGADLQTGVLVSLIDVADPTRPVERARRTIGGRGSLSASDFTPHGITVVRAADGRLRVSLPVTVHDGDAAPWAGMPEALRPRGFGRLAAWRFEVDPAAPALVERAPLEAPGVRTDGAGWARSRSAGAPAFDRALDAGTTTWLWFDGGFAGAPW